MPETVPNPSQNVGGDGKNTEAAGGGTGDPGLKEQQEAASGGNGNGGQNAGTAGSEAKFTQADIDAVAAKVRDEEKRKAADREERSRAEADRKKAEEQGEFQKLYEAEKAKNEAVQAKAEAAERYAERINKVIDDEVKDWPASVVKTDPGVENLDARLGWVETHRDMAKEILAAKAAPNGQHGTFQTGKKPDPVRNVLDKKYKGPASRTATQ